MYLTLALFGCLNSDRTDEVLDYEGPGSEAWGDIDITCGSSADCLSGELCIDGICQVEKCTSGLDDTTAPLGESLLFFQESEVAVADATTYQGSYWVDGYATDSGVDYDYSWDVGGSRIQDITGGDFLGTRPEMYAAITASSSKLYLLNPSSTQSFSLDFTPTSIGAGDVDGDGVDEAVVVSNRGDTAVCSLDTGSCDVYGFGSTVEVHDVAVGDVDGDTFAEIVYLLEIDGYRYLYGYNADYELTGQIDGWWTYPGDDDDNPQRITIGDLNGDRVEELIGLWNDYCYDWCDDSVVAWSAVDDGEEGEFYQVASGEADGYTEMLDVAAADTDLDEVADVYVLGADAELLVMKLSGSSLARRTSTTLDVSANPDRIAAADHDGDAPRAFKKAGPEPVEGAALPIMVMLLPPYDIDHSAEASTAGYGDGESTSESYTDTVSLGLSVDVGVSADFWSIFSAKLSEKVSWYTSESYTTVTTLYQGSRYSITADPELYGNRYGGVVLSWGCFDAYTYEVDDPGNHIGQVDDEDFVMVVPTGGGVSLWSTSRYNAMAEAVGTMPVIDIPYQVGDVDAYPRGPERIDGSPLETSDMLFPNPVKYTVSDVGNTAWWNMVSEMETNTSAMSTDLSTSASLTVAGVSFGVSGSYGWGESYSLTVGSNAMFNGVVPALPDDPDTPEDEYSTYRYSVTPYVYVHHYQDLTGNDSAFYVMTYAVEQ